MTRRDVSGHAMFPDDTGARLHVQLVDGSILVEVVRLDGYGATVELDAMQARFAGYLLESLADTVDDGTGEPAGGFVLGDPAEAAGPERLGGGA